MLGGDGYAWGHDPEGNESETPVPLSRFVEQLLKRIDKPPADVITKVFKSWNEIVGPDVARHCRPVAIDHDCVVVEADEPIWADELRWHSEAILNRIVEEFDNANISRLEVRVGYHRPSQADEYPEHKP